MADRADLDEIALALPEVVRGDGPSYAVLGKTFVWFREPHKDAVDAETGEPMDDVIVVHVGSPGDKEALVEADGPFFTTPHWNGYRAVLIRERHLGLVDRPELAELVTDAWRARAPKRLVREYDA